MTEKAKDSNQTITIVNKTGNAVGIASFIFGLISIFILSPLFVPLAFICGIIGIVKKQLVWSILGLVCALVGFFTSPILMGIFGLASMGALL